LAILEIRDLKKSYRSPDGEVHPVIDVPEFSLDEAEQVALEGGSGSGKTTLLNSIAGILKPDGGSIRVAGTEIANLSESRRDGVRSRHIGIIFQTFNLMQGYTALQNVELAMRFGKGVDRKFAGELLDRVGLAHRVKYRPGQMSVGQQQRVAVARALANRPELILADEPTGNLDYANAGEVIALIREVCKDMKAALLLVTHDREILGAFDKRRHLAEVNRAYHAPTGASASS
jgi:putative ABC transport system ATP-binding protein